jgi:hypothetical protein
MSHRAGSLHSSGMREGAFRERLTASATKPDGTSGSTFPFTAVALNATKTSRLDDFRKQRRARAC